ncbi:NAD(P)H-dependent oxidoreductase subunit E [Desulfobotulus sp. H1]|uniref:NAD(P)H-dependent oxidoreductase subunit E n=1 Tax=Desulfobotulus pelophilus TaxID=2823377 RepID=A0ABT3NA48_9BACT|nr:NAD(P)H-dependent oxidoreductase subunit E [Desulfobotulus pelophilus]MCW7754343.1 NAD(P)H-dependent oxidoreductase subunit E [Desulfobotulus pelophilus]
MEMQQELKLSDELLTFIDVWKEKRGNLIMILHRIQQEFGYVPKAIAIELSRYIEVPLAKIYGVLTFYHYFKQEKPGRNTLAVCTGTACYLKGAQGLLNEVENLLGVGVKETTDDGEFSVEAVRCIGCCGLSPVMTINDEVFGVVQPDDLAEAISRFHSKTPVN